MPRRDVSNMPNTNTTNVGWLALADAWDESQRRGMTLSEYIRSCTGVTHVPTSFDAGAMI